jgi:hypothetical protein
MPKDKAVKKSTPVKKMIFSKAVSDKFKKACKLKLQINELLYDTSELIRKEKESYFDTVGSDKLIFRDKDLNDTIVFFSANLEDGTPAQWDYRISISVERTINEENEEQNGGNN